MENEFITCPHCGTLNFDGKKTCSLCTFRLPVTTENVRIRYRRWNAVFLTSILIGLSFLIVVAITIHVYRKINM
jgi:ribosomal protein L37E